MADEPSTRVRSMVEKLLEADMADQIAQRSREIAEAVGEASDNVAHRAEEAWKESAPQRREAEKAARHAVRDAMRWGRRTWQHDVRPELRKLWKQRKVAIATAGCRHPGRPRAGRGRRGPSRHPRAPREPPLGRVLPRHPDRCRGGRRDRHPDHAQAGARDARRPGREGARRGREGARGGRRRGRMGAALPAGGGGQRRQCRRHPSADAFHALGEPPDQAGPRRLPPTRPSQAIRRPVRQSTPDRPRARSSPSSRSRPRAERKRCQIPCGWPSSSVSTADASELGDSVGRLRRRGLGGSAALGLGGRIRRSIRCRRHRSTPWSPSTFAWWCPPSWCCVSAAPASPPRPRRPAPRRRGGRRLARSALWRCRRGLGSSASAAGGGLPASAAPCRLRLRRLISGGRLRRRPTIQQAELGQRGLIGLLEGVLALRARIVGQRRGVELLELRDVIHLHPADLAGGLRRAGRLLAMTATTTAPASAPAAAAATILSCRPTRPRRPRSRWRRRPVPPRPPWRPAGSGHGRDHGCCAAGAALPPRSAASAAAATRR